MEQHNQKELKTRARTVVNLMRNRKEEGDKKKVERERTNHKQIEKKGI